MRVALGFTVILALSLMLIWQFAPQPEYRFERLVPSDALAVAVLSQAPGTLDALDSARIREFVDVDIEAIRQRVPEDIRKELSLLFSQDLDSAWLIVHDLERRDEAWRPHFTLALAPKPLHAELLELRTELLAIKLLGDTKALVSDNGLIRAYRGSSGSQMIYRVRMPGFLLLSNSEEGLTKTLRAFAGKDASLASSLPFQRVTSHLDVNQGFFLYVNSSRVLSFLPEFGYSVKWTQGEVRDEFYVTPGE
jgi:hypothetical protein